MATLANVCTQAVEIKKATEDDIPHILALIRGLAEYENFGHQMTATPESLRDSLFGEKPAAEVLLAFSGPRCVGFLVFFETFCSLLGRRGCFMDHLYVLPDQRGRGTGEALMQNLAIIARIRGYVRIEWHVLDWNTSAIGFYKKEGAELLESWIKCRMDDGAILSLSQQGISEACNWRAL